MEQLRVLIAEDNADIAENIGEFLELKGHHVDYAYDGQMAVSLVGSERFDIVVMDVMMPKQNGIEATKTIRTLPNGDIPILMLTARDMLEDKIEGLTCGADDYIVKPFDMSELYARMQAQVRKSTNSYNTMLCVGNIQLDKQNQKGKIGDCCLELNPTTFKIMYALVKSYPNLVDKSELEFILWGDNKPDTDILRSHIYNLRQSIKKCCKHTGVKGKHGKGYLLEMAGNEELG